MEMQYLCTAWLETITTGLTVTPVSLSMFDLKLKSVLEPFT